MQTFVRVALNYLVFLLVAVLLGAFQSSLWLQVFGFFPGPMLWIAVLTYWALYRNFFDGVAMTYLLAFVVIAFSGIPLEMAFGTNLCLFAISYVLRNRLLWSGPNSFIMVCGLAAFILPLVTFLLSFFLEEHSVSSFHFFDWFMRPILTAAFALPLFSLFRWLDQITQKSVSREPESGAL